MDTSKKAGKIKEIFPNTHVMKILTSILEDISCSRNKNKTSGLTWNKKGGNKKKKVKLNKEERYLKKEMLNAPHPSLDPDVNSFEKMSSCQHQIK